MNKLAENKQRKRLRLTMCFIYLFQIFLCTSPFVLLHSSNGAKLKDESVFSIIYKVLTSLGEIDNAGGFTQFLPYFFLVLIPVTGFFLCALDRERNIKNICAVVFNFFAIMAIMLFSCSLVMCWVGRIGISYQMLFVFSGVVAFAFGITSIFF
jgi:hypothetical protein